MRLGDDEKAYYLRVPGSAPAEPVAGAAGRADDMAERA
jgi:hypothetical protein